MMVECVVDLGRMMLAVLQVPRDGVDAWEAWAAVRAVERVAGAGSAGSWTVWVGDSPKPWTVVLAGAGGRAVRDGVTVDVPGEVA